MERHNSSIRSALAIGWVLVAVGLMEITRRALDGYSLTSLALMQRHTVDLAQGSRVNVDALLDSIPKSPLIPRSLFFDQPQPAPAKPVSPDALSRFKDYPDTNYRNSLLWNNRFLESQEAIPYKFDSEHFAKSLYAFEADWGSIYPRYRFPPNVGLPTGLSTNNWGWRGPDIDVIKPSKTIRIFALGDSTTVEQHHIKLGYPEYLERWLNAWAKYKGYDVRFEVANTGRETIHSQDVAAILRYEVMPFDPDYVIFYGLANQFNINNLLSLPEGVAWGKPDNRSAIVKTDITLPEAAKYSALVRRIWAHAGPTNRFLSKSNSEPAKPRTELKIPPEIDERHPDPWKMGNFLNLGQIVNDLDDMKSVADEHDTRFVMCTFRWLAYDGLKLDPVRNSGIYNYLNTMLWPTSYAQIQRLAAIQNRVYSAWARKRDALLVDLDRELPRDPELFVDPIHNSEIGVAFRAWTVLQAILPDIDSQIKIGTLPREATTKNPIHPHFGPTKEIRQSALRFRNEAFSFEYYRDRLEPVGELPLSALFANNSQTDVEAGVPTKVRTAPTRFSYAAEIQPNQLFEIPEGAVFVVDLEVTQGAVQVGVLSKDGSRFLRSETVNSARGRVTLPLALAANDQSNVGLIVIANGLDYDAASTAVIHSIKLLRPTRKAAPPAK